jgi:hypothetical protein
MSSSQHEFVLVPTRRDALTKPLTITPSQWQAALALCRRHGYSPPDSGWMSREVVRWFRRSLIAALNTITDPSARASVDRIHIGATLGASYLRNNGWAWAVKTLPDVSSASDNRPTLSAFLLSTSAPLPHSHLTSDVRNIASSESCHPMSSAETPLRLIAPGTF